MYNLYICKDLSPFSFSHPLSSFIPPGGYTPRLNTNLMREALAAGSRALAGSVVTLEGSRPDPGMQPDASEITFLAAESIGERGETIAASEHWNGLLLRNRGPFLVSHMLRAEGACPSTPLLFYSYHLISVFGYD